MSPRVYMIVSTGLIVPVAISMPRGWLTGSNPLACDGQRPTATVATTTTIPNTHPKSRQLGAGGRPSGNNNAKNKKRPMCGTHTQEDTQANVSPPSNLLGTEPGSARSVTMAYSAKKKRIPATKPMKQKIQPIVLRGGTRGAIMAPTVEKLTAITVFISQ